MCTHRWCVTLTVVFLYLHLNATRHIHNAQIFYMYILLYKRLFWYRSLLLKSVQNCHQIIDAFWLQFIYQMHVLASNQFYHIIFTQIYIYIYIYVIFTEQQQESACFTSVSTTSTDSTTHEDDDDVTLLGINQEYCEDCRCFLSSLTSSPTDQVKLNSCLSLPGNSRSPWLQL